MSTVPATISNHQIAELDDSFSIRLARKPDAVIAEANVVATALINAVARNGWAQSYGGKKPHLYFEAWAFLGAMYRVTARIRETRLIQIGDVTGYEAFAEALHIPTGTIIGQADAMCLDDEENWDMRAKYEYSEETRKREKVGETPVPLFQLRSMAQTRAMAKALKSPFSWIVAMAGYAPRTAEEGAGPEPRTARSSGSQNQTQQQGQQPRQQPGDKITAKQASRIWALGHTANKAKEDIEAIIKAHGFETVADVTVEKYEALCAEVQRSDAQ